MVQPPVIISAPLGIGQNMISLDDFLEKTQTLGSDPVRVVTFYDLTESLPDALCALVAWNSKCQVITLAHHGVGT